MSLLAKPPAKLNLTLAVGARGDDGFHPLRSVFLRLDLADELTVDLAPGAAADSLAIDGDFDCPVQGNLVLRAFDLLRRAVGQPLPALAARLVKRIPVGAGLGGGSSDGAAALELAQRAWGIGLAPDVSAELTLALGSDVPFFAAVAPAALVEGRGELVTPLPGIDGGAGVLLAVSPAALATASVYARFDDRGPSATMPAVELTAELGRALERGLDGPGLAALASRLAEANDLWPAASELAPELAARRGRLESATARPWLMSGSGPTLFALYPSGEEAAAESGRLAEDSLAPADLRLIATTAERRTS